MTVKNTGKPSGFFDEQSLRIISRHFRPDRNIANTNMMSIPYSLHHLVGYIERSGIDLREMKTLDLGCGHGFIVGAFAAHGCPAYGIEKDPALASYAEEKLKSLMSDSDYEPQIISGDYYEKHIFDKKFDDGTTMQDIDFFYCFPYSQNHALKMLVRTLAGRGKAKLGSLVYLPDLKHAKQEYLDYLGFELLDDEGSRKHGLFRKVSSKEFDPVFLDSF